MPTTLRPRTTPGLGLPVLANLASVQPLVGTTIPDISITGVTLRAQASQPGDLFAALSGSTAHGAQYVSDALAGGAVAVLTDSAGVSVMNEMMRDVAGESVGVPVLVHPQPRAVLGLLAAAVYGHPSHDVMTLGVTGTAGKTTTTYFLEAGLRSAGRIPGVIGTAGVRIAGSAVPSALTTPEAPELQALLAVMAERGVDAAAMEVSSHALALGRVDGIQFAVGGFTNLSRDHLDFHHTMQNYFDAKARLFDPAHPQHAATAVVCIDDQAGQRMAARAKHPVTVSAAGHSADWRVEKIIDSGSGTQEFTVVDPRGKQHQLQIHLPGRYNVANAVLAMAMLDAVGVAPEQAASGLQTAVVPGRLERIDCGQGFLAVVDYAHKPGALRAVLHTVRNPAARVAVVFGAGGARDPGKRAPMGRIAAELADMVIVTDDNPRDENPASIRAAIMAGAVEVANDSGASVVEIADRRSAINYAVSWARRGDVVVIAGKGDETGQMSGGQTLPFDDRVELIDALHVRGYHR